MVHLFTIFLDNQDKIQHCQNRPEPEEHSLRQQQRFQFRQSDTSFEKASLDLK